MRGLARSETFFDRRESHLLAPWQNRCLNESVHVYEVRPRKEHRGVDLISEALPFGRLWYAGPNAVSKAIGYAKFRSRSDKAVIRVSDDNVIETHEHTEEFKEP